jgi:hypothetical protein
VIQNISYEEVFQLLVSLVENVKLRCYGRNVSRLSRGQAEFVHACHAVRVRVRARVRSCGICGGQSDTGAGFLRVLRFPLPLIPSTAAHSVIIHQPWRVQYDKEWLMHQVDSASFQPWNLKNLVHDRACNTHALMLLTSNNGWSVSLETGLSPK